MVALSQHSQSRYEVLRTVNRGGMGEIALAKVKGAKGFDKLVVLKRLRPDAERDDHRKMFDIEAELMSRIEHPNIVQVFDQPIIDEVPYLAMSYVRGRNLDQLVRRTKADSETVPVAFALTVLGEVLRGLAFIHRLKDEDGDALGVVHQDITPSNILVSFFGEVKITDFGIAYVTSRDGGLREGVLKGKPRYVAPEVLAGRRVNNRVDIYGIALVLYELLTGTALFARAKVQETLTAVAKNELPDFEKLLPQVGAGVHELMRSALSKDPADRYRTAEEMNVVVQTELARLGGPLPAARIGYIMRERFHDDPDAPELDSDVDDGALSVSMLPQFNSPDLEQTLSELDRLLGADASSDLYALPPELMDELAGLQDMEPFAALTPLPQASAENEALLRSVEERLTPPPKRNGIDPPVHMRPPSDMAAFEDMRTDPALSPPRGTRAPIGSAITGLPMGDDLSGRRTPPQTESASSWAENERTRSGFHEPPTPPPNRGGNRQPSASRSGGEYAYSRKASKPTPNRSSEPGPTHSSDQPQKRVSSHGPGSNTDFSSEEPTPMVSSAVHRRPSAPAKRDEMQVLKAQWFLIGVLGGVALAIVTMLTVMVAN